MDPETSGRLGIQPEGRAGAKCAYVCVGDGGAWRGRKLSGWVGAGPWRPTPCMLPLEGEARGRKSGEMRCSTLVRGFIGGADYHCIQ